MSSADWNDGLVDFYEFTFGPLANDPTIEEWFDMAWATIGDQIPSDERMAARELFEEYLIETYGIDLEDLNFDYDEWWEALYGEV